MRYDNSRKYWTKAEAADLAGKTVRTNAGCTIRLTHKTFCQGANAYEVIGEDGYSYRKSCVNGLYCWLA